MNHYWQLIQKEHLFGLAAQTRMGVIRTVKPILPAETDLPQWPQRSRHALVQPLSASVLQIVTPLLDDFPAVLTSYGLG